MISGFDAYRIFVPLQLHFTTDYNFYASRGRVGSLNKRYMSAQRRQFEKLAKRKHNKETLFRFLVAQFERNPSVGIQDLTGIEADEISRRYNARIARMSYAFEEDVKMLLGSGLSWKQILVTGEIPLITKLMDAGDITKENVIILDMLFDMFDRWEVNIITDDIKRRLNNYRDFININKFEYGNTFKRLTYMESLL